MLGRSTDTAQQMAAAQGLSGTQLTSMAAQRSFVGNRPSVTFLYPKLTPGVLGQLIAAYEHRVFVEGAIWGINSFDQWGVELGKELATNMLPLLGDTDAPTKDGSTRGLLQHLRTMRS